MRMFAFSHRSKNQTHDGDAACHTHGCNQVALSKRRVATHVYTPIYRLIYTYIYGIVYSIEYK